MPKKAHKVESPEKLYQEAGLPAASMPLFDEDVPNPAWQIRPEEFGYTPSAYLINRLNYLKAKYRMSIHESDMNERLLIEGELNRRAYNNRQQT